MVVTITGLANRHSWPIFRTPTDGTSATTPSLPALTTAVGGVPVSEGDHAIAVSAQTTRVQLRQLMRQIGDCGAVLTIDDT